jgi:hypothetical protein
MRSSFTLALLLGLTATPVLAQPANDACSNATPVSCGNTYASTTAGATDDVALTCGTGITAPGVWYELEGTGQQVVVNTCDNAGYDTKLNVYIGGCGNFTCVAGNDDACDLASSVGFVAEQGVTYHILVQGYNGLTGTFNLQVECSAITLDACLGAAPIACGQVVDGNTDDATADNAPECGTDIQAPGEWYTFSGVEGQVILSTCPNSAYDTRLNVYSGNCGTLVCVTGNDDFPGALCSEAVFDASAATTYYVLVQGYDGNTGAYTLTMTCNSCSTPTAVTIDALDTSANVDWESADEGATYTVEYGAVGFTPGTGTILTGSIPANGPPVNLAPLTLATSYHVYITQDCGDEQSTVGPITFSTQDQPLAPNALCGGAIPLTCAGEVEGNTANGAVADAPTCGPANITTRGLWYTFTGDGQELTLSTCSNADYDTKISVFSGSCGNFTCVAGNDDAPDCTGNTSQLVFLSTTGTTYWVYVHGYGNAQGTFTLSLSCAPGCTPVENDNCTNPTLLSLQPTGGCEASTGTTLCAYAPATPNPPCDPFAPINDVWYTFNTGWATDVDILLALVDAGVVNAALYTACEAPEYIECWMEVDGSINVTGLPQNTDLLLRVWNGGGNEAGSFTLCVEAGITTDVEGQQLTTSRLWPVPATSTLTVRPVAGLKQLQVLDMQGRIVAAHGIGGADQVTIIVDALVPGVYLLRGDDGRQLGRFVKE